jgi:hypothetical protein
MAEAGLARFNGFSELLSYYISIVKSYFEFPTGASPAVLYVLLTTIITV